MKDIKNSFSKKLGSKTAETLRQRGMEAHYCENSGQALDLVLSMIPEGSSVSWGGSHTIKQIGLIDSLRQGNYSLIDRANAGDDEEKNMIMRDAFHSDFFLMSTNALTTCGMLVNSDGNGNRIAALAFGPKNVIVIAGINKIRHSLEEAISRTDNIAAPMNTERFILAGRIPAEVSVDKISIHTMITKSSRPEGRIKVIIVGEDLGY